MVLLVGFAGCVSGLDRAGGRSGITDAALDAGPTTTAAVAGRPPASSGAQRFSAAVESRDLCDVNAALQEMVTAGDDGLLMAAQMREAADAAERARAAVPVVLASDWDVVVDSIRRYAAALELAGGDTAAPSVRAIEHDAAYEGASARVSSWIRVHCGSGAP